MINNLIPHSLFSKKNQTKIAQHLAILPKDFETNFFFYGLICFFIQNYQGQIIHCDPCANVFCNFNFIQQWNVIKTILYTILPKIDAMQIHICKYNNHDFESIIYGLVGDHDTV